jgi:outer membrane protein assembly factor BamB
MMNPERVGRHGGPALIPVFFVIGLMALCQAATARAAEETPEANWPQWRGPLATGASPFADPPTTWSETSNVRWKVKIPGTGSATPLIWGNQVFLQTAIPTASKPQVDAGRHSDDPRSPIRLVQNAPPGGRRGGPGGGGRGGPGGGPKPTESYQFVLMCLDRQTGKVLWQQTAREDVPHEGVKAGDGTFASPSPITDGKHVYAYFGSRGLYCYDMDGKRQWDHDFGQMRVLMGFGEGSSPALYGDAIVVNWDHEGESFITALDKNTGNTLWTTPREERTSWSTPLIVEHDAKQQVVTAATGKIRSYDLASGKLIWECGKLTNNVIPSPVAADGIVYLTSGFRGHALLAIKLGRTGDLTGTDAIAWRHDSNTPYVPSPLLYDGRLYLLADNNGILSCFDAKTGKTLIDAQRVEGLPQVFASPVGAGGRVYLTGRNGAFVVLKNSGAMDVLSTNRLDDKFDASPAIAGKELFLRGKENLYCIAEK